MQEVLNYDGKDHATNGMGCRHGTFDILGTGSWAVSCALCVGGRVVPWLFGYRQSAMSLDILCALLGIRIPWRNPNSQNEALVRRLQCRK